MVSLGGLIVLIGAWVAVTGLLARSQLNSVRSDVHLLRAQIANRDLTNARKTAADLAKHAHRAHLLTAGPAWALAAALPAGGEPMRTVRGITSSADALGHRALPALVAARDKLDPSALRRPDGSVDIDRILAVAPSLATADSAMTKATTTIAGLPRRTWLSTVDNARADVLGQLQDLAKTVKAADLAAHVAPVMLGQHGTQRYFVGFQNEAEARGTGGLPGAFGILQVTHGKPKFTRFENDRALNGVKTDLHFGPDFDRLYGGGRPTGFYVNSNLSPNFPYAAEIWTAMWQKRSGQRLDGAIAVDPAALSYLLNVTGQATLPDGTLVSAENVVALTQNTAYLKFRDTATRKAFLLDIAQAASKRIVDAPGSTSALIDAAGKATGERRLLVWSAQPDVEAKLAQTSVGGVVPVTDQPYVGLSIVNQAGNKLDYYLDRSIRWERTGCGRTREVTVTVTLTNNAPTGLPRTVVNRSDKPKYPVKPGDNRLDVEYFGTSGGSMTSVTVDGRPSTAGSNLERGHPVFSVDLELPRASTRTVVFHLVEPAGSGAPIVVRQPLVRPLNVQLDDAHCD